MIKDQGSLTMTRYLLCMDTGTKYGVIEDLLVQTGQCGRPLLQGPGGVGDDGHEDRETADLDFLHDERHPAVEAESGLWEQA